MIVATANNLILHKEILSERLGIPIDRIEELLKIDSEGAEDAVLKRFNIEYHAPCDILQTYLTDESVDIITSRAVLEHIPPDIIIQMFAVFSRILKRDGVMCHIIDNSDHWEHDDKSISRLNFLKFNNVLFKVISSFNPLDFQNRLRHFEYLDVFEHTGFKIDYDGSVTDEKAQTALAAMKLCEKYRGVSHRKLAILTSYIVASKS